MSDQIDDNDSADSTPLPTKQERLERILASRGAVNLGESPPVTVTPTRGNLRYSTATDSFTNLDTGESFPASEVERVVPGDQGERIEDDGRSLEYEWSQNRAEWDRRQAVLEAVQFDQKTGERSYVLQGAAREQFAKEFHEYDHSMRDQQRIYTNLAAQRERDKAAKATAAAAALARDEDLHNRALLAAEEAEVQELAAILIAKRRKDRDSRDV